MYVVYQLDHARPRLARPRLFNVGDRGVACGGSHGATSVVLQVGIEDIPAALLLAPVLSCRVFLLVETSLLRSSPAIVAAACVAVPCNVIAPV